ncbi:hypothetical protein ROA7450_03056 [Roseovarius albus]|uniref:Secreted protein n=1 Tax=Roseovarius albus TaxID=1247867 RepID=A0A1X6ZR13_9RHOB|nr:hypothetical protein [Roseovarius albus]SLN59147.1 hypothetical protein ROA7450_03056 [Roseovarius albus]
MTNLKILALAASFACSASFISTAYADTVGCYNCKSYNSYDSAHWDRVIGELEGWMSSHGKYHPYYYTMKKHLVNAKYKKKYRNKNYHGCKDDVSPS